MPQKTGSYIMFVRLSIKKYITRTYPINLEMNLFLHTLVIWRAGNEDDIIPLFQKSVNSALHNLFSATTGIGRV